MRPTQCPRSRRSPLNSKRPGNTKESLGEQDTAEATDAADEAAIECTRKFARKIVALPGMDLAIMRMKARAYLWGKNETFERFAKSHGDGSAEAILVSLFTDLGAHAA